MAKSLMMIIAFMVIPGFSQAEVYVKKVKFVIGKNIAVVSLYNTPAAKDFIEQLPLTLEFKDFASKEKISYPPKKLSTKKDSPNKTPSEGDFAYYAPWGNIAVFYKNVEPATSDLLILGRFDSGKEFFNVAETFKATIEVVE